MLDAHARACVCHSLFTTKVRGARKTGKRAKKKDKDTFVRNKDEDDEIPDLLDNFDPEEYYETVKAEKERRKHCKEDRLR